MNTQTPRIDLDQLPEAYRGAVESLSVEELNTLLQIQAHLTGDEDARGNNPDVGIFFY